MNNCPICKKLFPDYAQGASENICECYARKPLVESSEKPFEGYAMYPTDISLLLERLGAEFPDEMGSIDIAIMNQCKTIMRENKSHWENFGVHGGAAAPAPLDSNDGGQR